MKTASTNKKIRELISMVKERKLVPRPEFQRRLVWTHKDKDHFLDTVLRGFPFPEIYLADGEVDLESGEGTQLLVDGLQRVHTLLEYFDGSQNLRLITVPPYRGLDEEGKRAFLQYDVAVRDLGNISKDQVVEVFQRINATKYSLLDIEVNNAVYSGALKQFCQQLAEHPFFLENGVFDARDFKRMGDLRFALTLVCTVLAGYFNRDEAFGEFLQRFNDDFPLEGEVRDRLSFCFDFLTECGFEGKSRIWRKADLFTAVVELDGLAQADTTLPQPSDLVGTLSDFYVTVDASGLEGGVLSGVYYKAAIQATNDRVNRLRRGVIVGGLLRRETPEAIERSLRVAGLL